MSVTTSGRKKQLNIGSSVCECTSCGRFFGGVSTFDTHLVRNTRNPDIEPRCMTDQELQNKGIAPNPNGVYSRTYKAK